MVKGDVSRETISVEPVGEPKDWLMGWLNRLSGRFTPTDVEAMRVYHKMKERWLRRKHGS
jgi:hypothetical protein